MGVIPHPLFPNKKTGANMKAKTKNTPKTEAGKNQADAEEAKIAAQEAEKQADKDFIADSKKRLEEKNAAAAARKKKEREDAAKVDEVAKTFSMITTVKHNGVVYKKGDACPPEIAKLAKKEGWAAFV